MITQAWKEVLAVGGNSKEKSRDIKLRMTAEKGVERSRKSEKIGLDEAQRRHEG